ncbi:MAG: GYF domain-containing protein [Byssovorax sp.]
MSNGQACFEIEDPAPTGDVDPSPPASGVRQTLHTIPLPDGRSAAATVPGAGVDRFAATLAALDERLDEHLAPPPFEWCVDLGVMLITKTTFDLWAAIEQGEIGGSMLVWREGMECWTPVDRVGELACALEAAPPAVEQSPEPAEATTNPEVRIAPIEPDPPRISSRRQVPLRAANAGGGKWVALGSAVAASAIAAAMLTTFLATTPAAESTRTREVVAASVAQGAARAAELPDRAAIDPATVAAPTPPKARHAESGQRRRR